MKVCSKCGAERRWLHEHHIQPKSRQGSEDASNKTFVCANCHEDIHGGPYGGVLAHDPAAIDKQRAANLRSWRDPVRRAKRLVANARSGERRRQQRKGGPGSAHVAYVTKERLDARYRKSLAHLPHALAVTPGGSQTLSKAPSRFPIGAYPLFAAGGRGAYLVDLDGHEYIDWTCALGAVTLGYAYGPVVDAASEVCSRGMLASAPDVLEQALAEAYICRLPGAESVRFTKSGTESCMAAVRVARIATGRSVVLTTSGAYHGWADWFMASKPEAMGIPQAYRRSVKICEHQNLDALRMALDADVACVIIQTDIVTDPLYLSAVVRLAHNNGSLVIFDEMISGFRWTIGGAGEKFSVTPDLATYGKCLANGLPLACLVGRRDIMAHAKWISGTFFADAMALAAGLVVLETYKREPIIERLSAVGTQLQQAYNELATGYGLPTRCSGQPWSQAIAWECEKADLAMSLFLQETALRGVAFHPSTVKTSAAMSDEDVLRTVSVCSQVLRGMRNGDWDRMFKGQLIERLSWRDPETLRLAMLAEACEAPVLVEADSVR